MKENKIIYCSECKKVFDEGTGFCSSCGKPTIAVRKKENDLYILYWFIPVIIWLYLCNVPSDSFGFNALFIGLPLTLLLCLSIVVGIVITVIMVRKNKENKRLLDEISQNNLYK